jgi:hypothetical protein
MASDQIPALCIIADVIASRRTDKKPELRSIVEIMNNRFRDSIITDFTLRNGDEVFGLLNKFSNGYHVLKGMLALSEELSVPLYVGIGIGFISNEDLDNPNEVNGTAIWNAADALISLKSKKSSGFKPTSHHSSFKWLIQASKDIPYDVLNYQIYFLFERLLKRTDKQKEIVKAVETSENGTLYDEIGEKLGYDRNSSSNVSKLLARADHHLVTGAEQSLCALLDYYQDQLSSQSNRGTLP